MLTRGPIDAFLEVPFAPIGSLFSVELQAFHAQPDSVALVKLQHRDDTVELYADRRLGWTERHVRSDPAFGHLGLRRLVQTDLGSGSLDAGPSHVDGRLQLDLDDGRRLALRVESRRARPALPMFTPAPPQSRPATLRLLHMDAFWFLPTSTTDIELTVDGRPLHPVRLGHRRMPRYSARVGSGLDLSGINVQDPPPEFGPSECFSVVAGETPDEFAIDGPLGTVVTGRVDGDCLRFQQCWSPRVRRPAVAILARLRAHRRRNERWRWCGDHPASGRWTT